MNRTKILLLVVTFALAVPACSNNAPTAEKSAPAPLPDQRVTLPTPVALPPMEIPADNPMTPEKAGLGKQLFFDKRLSKTGNMSCETCHLPEKGWADGNALSARFDGSMNTRHTPTLYNVGYYKQWYWDGRAATLEAQVTAAWRGQMGGDPDAVAKALNDIPAYKQQFEQYTGGPATPDSIAKSLATFVRTIVSDDAPWDRYEKGNKEAASADAIAGFDVFSKTASCTNCHLPPLYTDTLFHNIGVGYDKPMPDPGRGKILADKDPKDPEAKTLMGAFKTPTVRSVTENAPYFHDGRAASLEDAVDFILKGGVKNPSLDGKLQAKKLSAQQRDQLMAFIKALTPEQKPFEKPKLP
jgi:cytochrome c peroxidase